MDTSQERYWNYRIVELDVSSPHETYMIVTEVHYRDGVPKLYSPDGASVAGESIDSLKWHITKIQEAIEKPILKESIFL